MENNIADIRRRRSSLGRSSLIERSISLLNNFLSNNLDEEEFSGMIVNNEMLSEFRSILWRVFLGILSTPHSKKGWIQATKLSRKSFDNIISEENFQNILNFYNNKLNNTQNQNYTNNFDLKFDLNSEFDLIKNELDIYSQDYDIFKSEFLKKSFLTIYLAWRLKNTHLDLNKNAVTFICKILAILIYSLYPCIIHLNENFDDINDDEEDIKNVFYFLNLEDYFEHDIFEIFEKVVNISNLLQYVVKYSQDELERNLDKEIKDISKEDQNLADLLDKKLNINSSYNSGSYNFLENVCYIYLYAIDQDLFQMLHSKGIDIYNITANYYLSLFYNATKFENITYYIDNVLMHSKTEDFRFLSYLVISTLINLKDDFAHSTKADIENVLNNFPLLKRDPKDIVGKALKIRQKLNKKFFNK